MFLLAIACVAAADVSVDDISISEINPAVNGHKVIFLVDMSNKGTDTLTGGSYTATFGRGADAITRQMPAYAAGDSWTEIVPVNFNESVANNITVTATATNDVNASNNAKAMSFVISNENKDVQLTVSKLTVMQGKTETASFKIKNNGNVALDDVSFSVTDLEKGSYKIDNSKITITPANLSLIIGQEETITIKVQATSSQRTGTYEGDLTVNYDGKSEKATLRVEVEEEAGDGLDINEVRVAGDKIKDGETEKITPGTELAIKVEVENNANDDLEDVEVKVTIEGSDWDDDDDKDLGDVDEDDEASTTFKFDVPSDVEDGDEYTITVEVEGYDNDNDKYTDKFEATLEIDKERDDVRVKTLDLGRDELKAGESTQLSVRIENYGSDDQDEVKLSVTNSALGLNKVFKDMDLDEGDHTSKSISVDVPSTAKAGTYTITAKVYIEGTDLQDTETIELKVKAEPKPEPQPVIEPPKTIPGATETGGAALASEVDTRDFREKPAYKVLLILAILVVILGGVFMLYKLM